MLGWSKSRISTPAGSIIAGLADRGRRHAVVLTACYLMATLVQVAWWKCFEVDIGLAWGSGWLDHATGRRLSISNACVCAAPDMCGSSTCQ